RFQNGDLKEGVEGQLQTGVYKDSDNKTVVAAATKEMLYTGHVEEDENVNRFLLISNKKTGEARLVAVDIAVLGPQLDQKTNEDFVDNPAVNTISAEDTLNKEFRSTRMKQKVKRKERLLKVNIDNMKDQLKKTVEGVKINESESFSMLPDENEIKYRPLINRNASTRQQVYSLNDIVPEEILNSLEPEAHRILSSDLEQFSLSPFIKQPLVELQNSSVCDRVEKCELLLYINYLITYFKEPPKNIRRRFIICKSSQNVNSHILDNFSVSLNGVRTKPQSMMDKAIYHILVLSMIAFVYELDIEALARNIVVSIKKLQKMGKILAFSPHGENKNMMVLKVPLPSSSVVFGRNKHGKKTQKNI
ncbi:RNA pol I A49 domain containing protein, partial [Asbolus verrucosus]